MKFRLLVSSNSNYIETFLFISLDTSPTAASRRAFSTSAPESSPLTSKMRPPILPSRSSHSSRPPMTMSRLSFDDVLPPTPTTSASTTVDVRSHIPLPCLRLVLSRFQPRGPLHLLWLGRLRYRR
ncbi:hypothetical protein CPC08DRAFT_504720 [Agrocybe pediades]|nr:hypothetical protein CPC08DRAFT_504720 [Agrocybe pediades]